MISREPPDTPDALGLIAELEDHLQSRYAPENRHGFSVDRLIAEGVEFFVLRVDGTPAGCAGIMVVGTDYAEIKRMYVRPQCRGRGFAKSLLDHLADYARSRDIPSLRLETGVHQREAIGLYEGMGFRRIPAFGPYKDDGVSLCFEKRIR